MESPSFPWISTYAQPNERLRSTSRAVPGQHNPFDQIEPLSHPNFFPQFPISSGFPFHELDYRLQEGPAGHNQASIVEQAATVPSTLSHPGELHKNIPEVKPFTPYASRGIADTEFSLFNHTMFQYPVPNIDVSQFAVRKGVKDEFAPYHAPPFQQYSNPPSVPIAQTFGLSRPTEKPCNTMQDCQVCHSTLANGLHFGARTCAACAAFFRRTISDGKKYVCKRSQRCNNPTKDATGYRKICRSCRLKRCMDIGMLPDNVQHKRCRRDSPPPAVPRVFNTMLQPFYNQIPNNGVSNISSSI